jgi:hypothetical protein
MGTLERIAPIFPVRDLRLSLEHYGRLGFATREYHGDGYGYLTRDGVEIHLGDAPRVHDAAAASRLATIAKSNAACRPARKGAAIRPGKKLRPVRAAAGPRLGARARADQVLDRVVAQEGGEEGGDRRQVRGLRRPRSVDTPWATSPW